ncbi:MAG: hypothetical protein HY511_03295 [Actinobacteria bacterium]|nr:hypothetical protein [Actinomycetota bacterium]
MSRAESPLQSTRQARGRRRRRRPLRPLRLVLGLALAAGVFAAGLSLGRALDEGPSPGGTRTIERTLKPLPLVPASPPTTVTVTVTAPG